MVWCKELKELGMLDEEEEEEEEELELELP